MGPHLASTTRNQCRCGCNAVSAGINNGAAQTAITPARRQVKDGHGGGRTESRLHPQWRTAAAMAVEGPRGCTKDEGEADG